MSLDNKELRDGFILRPGRLRKVTHRELPAATHLIGGFNLGTTPDNLMAGTVVWFRGNTRGFKVPGGVELGPEVLGTAPGGFWAQLEDDLKQSMRLDRQKYCNEGTSRFCIYHIQVGEVSIACVLIRVHTQVGPKVMRRAFELSLQTAMNVTIDPTDAGKGYMHVK